MFRHEDIAEKLPPDLREPLGRPATIASATPVYVSEPQRLTDLTVHVLGPVDIFRDPAKPFAQDAWTTRRARDIFCFIATRKNRRVAKDVLIDTFWGEEDPATIEKNFHPTISHIRKALNSRQALKQNFIIFRDGSYQLNPEFTYSIDSEDFEDLITSAEHAKREKNSESLRQNLESARALYRGDFMEGSYDNWAETRRHYYREQIVRVLNGLAKLSATEKRWSDAMRFSKETLELDPFREDLHRLVMKVLAAQGKTAGLKKYFGEMQDVLRVELGIEPSAETQRLYQELVK
jgi:two-component SAPR family response regulator